MLEHAKHTILLCAEDDIENQFRIRLAFHSADIPVEIHFVNDGVQLLDYLYRRNAYDGLLLSPRPDIILIDLKISDRNGYEREAIGRIQADAALRQIPIVVFSSEGRPEAQNFLSEPSAFSGIAKGAECIPVVANALNRSWFSSYGFTPGAM